MKNGGSTLDLISGTPLVAPDLIASTTGKGRLLAKVEGVNPGGRVKDWIALAMILAAEKEGKLKIGDTVVETTSGNTWIGLAVVCAVRG